MMAPPSEERKHTEPQDTNLQTQDSDSPTPIASPVEEFDDDDNDEIPLTLAASVVLSDLPKDAATALADIVAATASQQDKKIIVRFKAVGSAPQLAQDVCKISAARRFEEVVRYLRRKLRCAETDSVFLYVNSAFAPSLDEVVGNLHQCFKNSSDHLVVAYSMTPAFG
ncbi:Putative Ubiquitin-like autophagy protein Apg12 [[Torrubiella] hemipterigena]|uniref:Ubiquitin-like protein ATG12 n=1 Tax=[Torrubiella] hemipterigena TaxID=1531966 RepID=A0A0A1TAF0_9HYPO|nr:Putative Ubiquitin-like autophagy protein Apg12 [[Torrubiella] hemipterigena]